MSNCGCRKEQRLQDTGSVHGYRGEWDSTVSPPPEEQHVEPGQSQLKHTRTAGIQTLPKTVLPPTPSIQLIKIRMGTGGTLIYISELEQQPTTSQPTAKCNYWKLKQSKCSWEIMQIMKLSLVAIC